VYPNIFSPPLFQLFIIPSRDLLMIASSDDSTMAARWPIYSSSILWAGISIVVEGISFSASFSFDLFSKAGVLLRGVNLSSFYILFIHPTLPFFCFTKSKNKQDDRQWNELK